MRKTVVSLKKKRTPGEIECVDIVIPVYNAFEYVQECLQSVFRHTPSVHSVTIIDDKSTDKRIPKLLSFYKKQDSESVTILTNTHNSGFVKSVNHGMRQHATKDVILLNTDTVVTKNWVEKLHECAYSDKSIATVTPLTNNGNSICSIPAFGHVNELPKRYSINSFAELVQKMSARSYPEIPTAVGFCMFIKRAALDEIGLFDEKSFGQGYGEETDFSLRAKAAKWKNALDDATYIFHKGHASFDMLDAPASAREKKGLEILKKRYPRFLPEWKTFMKTNPLLPIHRRIFFGMRCKEWKVPVSLSPMLYKMYCLVR